MRLRNIIMCAALAGAMALGTSGCSKTETSLQGNVQDVVLEEGDTVAEIVIRDYGTIYAKLYPDAAPVGVENFTKLAESGYYDGLTIHRVISGFMMQGGSLNGDGTGGEALVEGGSFGVETDDNMRHFYGALCYANAMGTNTTQFYIVNNKEPQNLSEDYDVSDFESYADTFGIYAEMYADQTDYAEYYSFRADYYSTIADWIGNASDEVRDKYMQVGGTPTLDGNYTVFGQVYDGFDVIDAISAVEVEDNGNDEVSKPVDDIIIESVTVYTYSQE